MEKIKEFLKKIVNKIVPRYIMSEQEEKVVDLLTELLKDENTDKVLYDICDAYIYNKSKGIEIAIVGSKLTILSKSECYSMMYSGNFTSIITDILSTHIRESVEAMEERMNSVQTSLLTSIIKSSTKTKK